MLTLALRRTDLFRLESGRNPGVLLGSAAGVIVRDGVSLKIGHQLRHHLLQLTRDGADGMLLTDTLAVHTDLPATREIESNTRITVRLPALYRVSCGATL